MKKILIADDSNTMIKLLSVYLLEYFGEGEIEILKANDGADALFMLHDHDDIELIFLDITMPIVDGHSVGQYLHSREIYIPTVIISATMDKEMVISLGKLGLKYFLPKPISKERFLTVMETIKENSAKVS